MNPNDKFLKFYAILVFVATAIMARSFYVLMRDHFIFTRAIEQKPVQVELKLIEEEEVK